MKRIIYILILVLTLASCAPVPKPAPAPSSQETPAAAVSAIPAPSPASPPFASPPPPALTASVDLPAYKAAYVSCGKGEKISQSLSTGDMELFFTKGPKELTALLGGDYEDIGFVDDEGSYVYHYEALGITLFYNCITDETPLAPLKCVKVHDYDFRGLNEESDFDSIMNKLGKARKLKIYLEDNFWVLQYRFGKLLFKFGASDEEGTEDGTSLVVYPNTVYKKYYPVDVKKIDGWFAMPKTKLIETLGKDYIAEEGASGISGVYDDYTYKEKGITLHFDADRLATLELDGRYQVGGAKKASDFAAIQKILGPGELSATDDDPCLYTLTYTYKNFVLEFYSYDEDGFGYETDICSISVYEDYE